MTVYHRASQDIGNVIVLEHVNLKIPNQETATAFYVSALGLTRDPYMTVGTNNMWINAGRQQFHLPRGEAQRFRGTICITLPEHSSLIKRLEYAREELANTEYCYTVNDDGVVHITCPWGNRFNVTQAAQGMRDPVGINKLIMPVTKGVAERIAGFYSQCLGAKSDLINDDSGSVARITVGPGQTLDYVEQDEALPDWDGHHIAIYVANFSQPHDWLRTRGLITREDNDHQYRFSDLKDSESSDTLFSLEHEVRSLHHPLYNRLLVNR